MFEPNVLISIITIFFVNPSYFYIYQYEYDL
jgi:hypothetical protein